MLDNVPGEPGEGRDHDIKVWGARFSKKKNLKFMITDTFGHYNE